jgi:hypothetical protein
MVAYWYPQIAVYDDVTGWQIDPYLGNAEFYMGYADYDVNISLPQGWLVGATGELTNPNDVLSVQTRNRLAESKRSASVVRVVRDGDRGAGATKATNTGFDGVLTWRFRARNVRDFDWAHRRSSCGTQRSPSWATETGTAARTRPPSTRSIDPRRARGRGTSLATTSATSSNSCRPTSGLIHGRR